MVTEDDLAGKNAKFGTPVDAANLAVEYDRVITFKCLSDQATRRG